MNQFKHANWWRSYLGELSKDFGRLQAWISSGNTSTSHGNTILQRKNNGEEENRVKKIEDSSYSLLSHFWSTSRSSFFACYIPFEILGSQESNALNSVWFGAEMRKIWPSEDNCIMPNDQFRKVAKISQGDFPHGAKFGHFAPWRTTLRNFARWLFTLRNLDSSSFHSTAGSPRYFAWFLAL